MSIYGYRVLFSIGSIAVGTHVPISSASARLRSGAPSYLQVTIPDYHTWVDVIVNPAIDLYLYKRIIGTGTWELKDGEILITINFNDGKNMMSYEYHFSNDDKTLTLTDAGDRILIFSKQ